MLFLSTRLSQGYVGHELSLDDLFFILFTVATAASIKSVPVMLWFDLCI